MIYHRCPGCSAMTKRRTVCDACFLHFAKHPQCTCNLCHTADTETVPSKAVVNVVAEAGGMVVVDA